MVSNKTLQYFLILFLYIIIFQIKFILNIIRNDKIVSNNIISIIKLFWQLTISNIPRIIIDQNKIITYYNICFKKFFNKFILASGIGKVYFLDFGYRKNNLGYKNHKLKK